MICRTSEYICLSLVLFNMLIYKCSLDASDYLVLRMKNIKKKLKMKRSKLVVVFDDMDIKD